MGPKLIKKKTVKKVKVPKVETTESKKVVPDIQLSKEQESEKDEKQTTSLPVKIFPKFSKKKMSKNPEDFSSIIKISRLPYGFFEEELLNFFTQFGKVIRVRVPRSKKTLNFKRYAYVEFELPEIAEIVAETMDNHMMFDNLIKVQHLKYKDVPEKFFTSRRVILRFSKNKTTVIKEIKKRSKPFEGVDWNEIQKKITNKYKRKQDKLGNLGINYQFPKIQS
ncbi:MKI67 FHA domain-interacting nucleolar phosphoprotein [Strongyloides ratti]|uniref:MKI67 FHA domain-interacting nucleolar phosphoprotein n=1 Tax=Strongyloides ratti TaxID=34506 RepID=A0A090LBZ4_STRRB|nr:MKI67 FHA domain-interacting nucleolar phosphoprotein [Strongyloides ratti]CEF67267.1 MKI67 FHA domain-interacting nucleolar phosphoprotein [Strongyloides ratti]